MTSLKIGVKPVVQACAAAAVMLAILCVPAAQGGSGGVNFGSGGGGGDTAQASSASTPASASKYDRLWTSFKARDRRWAHRTAECESGRDPKAIGGGGMYRGAFQFLKSSWANAPKSPGGDPIAYPYRTQAVVAVLLMHRMGTSPWPVCG